MSYAATLNYASGTGPPRLIALGAAALHCFGEPSFLVVRQSGHQGKWSRGVHAQQKHQTSSIESCRFGCFRIGAGVISTVCATVSGITNGVTKCAIIVLGTKGAPLVLGFRARIQRLDHALSLSVERQLNQGRRPNPRFRTRRSNRVDTDADAVQ